MKSYTSPLREAPILLTIILFILSACQPALPDTASKTTAVPTALRVVAEPVTRKTPTSTPLRQPRHLNWKSQVDTNLAWYVEHAPLAGATIAIQYKDESLFLHAYGLENLSPAISATEETIYEIGSITKQFTAAAILRLAEQGRLSLNDPITTHLPALPPNLSGIQIRHLLNHTSGLIEPEAYYVLFEETQVYPPQEILEKTAGELETGAEPETTWAYSNYGYFLLGMIIESASGLSYQDYLAENLLLPAGLQSTHYCPGVEEQTAQGYMYENRDFKPVDLNLSLVFSAGGLCSTAVDLLAWQNALVTGEVIGASSYQEMITPISPEKLKENYVPYGYGVLIDNDQGKKLIHHGGYVYGTESYLLYYPDHDLTIVMLTNTGTIGTSIYDFVRSNIVPIIFGE
jgi:CubicO group peptidase (beta-lactamase class C family)